MAEVRLAGMAYDTELADRIRFLIGMGPVGVRPDTSTRRVLRV